MKKRIFALVLSALLLVSALSVTSFAAEEPTAKASNVQTTAAAGGSAIQTDDVQVMVAPPTEGSLENEEGPFTVTFKKVAENTRYKLYFDEDNTFVKVQDKTTGQEWLSNPVTEKDADAYARGITITNMRSQLHVIYYTGSYPPVQQETNSAAASVSKGTYKITAVNNGVRIDYEFKEMEFTIPVQYTLTDEGLLAEILYSDIKQKDGGNSIASIDFLQYFGTANEQDKGYMLVPDGSGAIINMNNGKSAQGMNYNKTFYGTDLAATTSSQVISSRNEKLSMPVYGMVKNGYGWLAEVTSGAENASLNAYVSGNQLIGGYNTIYTTAVYHVAYKIPMMDQLLSNASDVLYLAQDTVGTPTYSVLFRFSDKQNTSYVDLALMYQKTLQNEGWLNQDKLDTALYTTFYGGVSKKKSFAGFPYTARETLTSFSEAQTMLQDMRSRGVSDISAMYSSYSDDIFNRKIEIKLTPSGSLGGTKALSSLLEFAKGENVNLAMGANFMMLPSGGNGFSTFSDVTDTINVEAALVYENSLNSNVNNTSIKPYYLLAPDQFERSVNTLMDSAAGNNYTALYLDEKALSLYSDFVPGGQQRSAARATMQAALQTLSQKAALTLSNPNAYLYRYASAIVDVPTCSSKSVLFDQDIPFVQAVLKGMKNFSGESVNITDSSQEGFLKLLEYGSGMKYSLINSSTEVLLNTDMTFLYSATYDVFKDQIQERYAKYKEVQAMVDDATMVAHQNANGLAITTYSNGVKVYVNYNAAAVSVDGVTVPASGYTVQ